MPFNSLFNTNFFALEIIKYFRFRRGIKYYDFKSFINLKLINKKFYTIVNSQNNCWHNVFCRIIKYVMCDPDYCNDFYTSVLCQDIVEKHNIFYINDIPDKYYYTCYIYKGGVILYYENYIDNGPDDLIFFSKIEYFDDNSINDLISLKLTYTNNDVLTINNTMIDKLTDKPIEFIKHIIDIICWRDFFNFDEAILSLQQLYKEQSIHNIK